MLSTTPQATKTGPADASASRRAGTRLVASNLASAIERFDDPALLGEGKVNIISVEAIAQRLGPRWPQRQEQVYDHVARTLEKNVGPQGYFARISEIDYLICQPELGRFSAQVACLRSLREILTFFLGDDQAASSGVHQVTKLSQGAVIAQQVDARHVEREGEREEAARRWASSEGDSAPTMDRWSPFVATDGRRLRVSCVLEPVFELKTFGRIGFRMARRVMTVGTEEVLSPAAVANLSRADLLRIDLATIARGLDRLRSAENAEREPSLIVPLSYFTLSNQRTRDQVAIALKTASSVVRHGIISDICNIEGVPQVALLSAASLIRPFSLFVVGRLSTTPPTAASLAQLRNAGLDALSFECPRNVGEAEFVDWAKATIDGAKQIAKPVLTYGANSAREAGMLALMGATHASVRN